MMKENLLLLKDSVELWKIKFINIWLEFKKNVYIDKLGDIVHKYNNTYHWKTKMKPVDIKSKKYIDSSQENNN